MEAKSRINSARKEKFSDRSNTNYFIAVRNYLFELMSTEQEKQLAEVKTSIIKRISEKYKYPEQIAIKLFEYLVGLETGNNQPTIPELSCGIAQDPEDKSIIKQLIINN